MTSQTSGIVRSGRYLWYYQRQPLPSTNGIVFSLRLCITIDLWDSLTLVGEASDLIKGPPLTYNTTTSRWPISDI